MYETTIPIVWRLLRNEMSRSHVASIHTATVVRRAAGSTAQSQDNQRGEREAERPDIWEKREDSRGNIQRSGRKPKPA